MKIFHFFNNFASNKEAIEKMAEKPLTKQSSLTMIALGFLDTIKFCGGAAAAYVAHDYLNGGSTKGSTGNYNNRIGNYGRKKRYLK